jgi:hypothetical protein
MRKLGARAEVPMSNRLRLDALFRKQGGARSSDVIPRGHETALHCFWKFMAVSAKAYLKVVPVNPDPLSARAKRK